jgi:cytochrome c553
MDTKSVALTESEIKQLISCHASTVAHALKPDYNGLIDRMNYLNKRLKAFKEVEPSPLAKAVAAAPIDSQFAADAKAYAEPKGWGNN